MRPHPEPPAPAAAGPATDDLLQSVARLVDEGAAGDRNHLLVHVSLGEAEELDIGLLPLDRSTHPFRVLAGMRAPGSWHALGVRAVGTARHLDRPGDRGRRCANTVLLDRRGGQASLLRTGDHVEVLEGRMDGTIPDACRRALGLPTDPPPASSAALWTLVWLDRAMAAWTEPATRRAVSTSWPHLARLHPAAERKEVDLSEPAALVDLGREHAAAWPWSRLREEPEVLTLPGGDLPRDVTSWMDDGFYARWALGGFPSIDELGRDLPALLGPPVGTQLAAVALALLA